MSRKKKRRSKKRKARRRHKVSKSEQIHAFRRKIEHITEAAAALDAYYLIPKEERDFMLSARFRPLRVEAGSGRDVPAAALSAIRKDLSKFTTTAAISIFPDGPKITLHDFFTAGLTLQFYLDVLEEHTFKGAADVKKAFTDFMDYTKHEDIPCHLLFAHLQWVSWRMSEVDSGLYWLDFEIVTKRSMPPILYGCVIVNLQGPDVKHIRLDGNHRPVYRIGTGIFSEGIQWASIRPADLKITGALSELPLDVYIQSHALLRLDERLDCENTQILHFYLYDSVANLQTCTAKNGQCLVEYRLYGIKVGYLVIDIVEGIALIRTFLFLTNSGTPEGEKLTQHLGLETMEKKYLEIDKLSTFAVSDLRENESLKKLFIETGCGGLFDLTAKDPEANQPSRHAASIAKYLGLGQNATQ